MKAVLEAARAELKLLEERKAALDLLLETYSNGTPPPPRKKGKGKRKRRYLGPDNVDGTRKSPFRKVVRDLFVGHPDMTYTSVQLKKMHPQFAVGTVSSILSLLSKKRLIKNTMVRGERPFEYQVTEKGVSARLSSWGITE